MRYHAALAALLAALAPLPALAGDPAPSDQGAGEIPPEARQHFDRGTIHYNLQEWPEAIAEYKEAYRISPRPELLWALAQAQRLSGDCSAAIKSYQAFLRYDPSAQQSALAWEFIAKCQTQIADEKKAEPPPKEPEKPSPAAALRPSPAPAPATPEVPPRWYTDGWGHALFFGGAAIAAAGGVLLVLGNGDVQEANAATSYASFVSERDSGQGLQRWGVVGLAVGGTLAMGGVVRYIVVGGRGGGQEAAGVTAAVGLRGLGASLSGRF